MSLTTRDLFEIAGLNTDGVEGFLAQCRNKRHKGEVLWPEHLRDKRLDDFREGARLARNWLAMRRGYAVARRKRRTADFRDEGATTCLLPEGADRREEQLHCLREVVKFRTGAASPSDATRA
jgi:hypothetical protein